MIANMQNGNSSLELARSLGITQKPLGSWSCGFGSRCRRLTAGNLTNGYAVLGLGPALGGTVGPVLVFGPSTVDRFLGTVTWLHGTFEILLVGAPLISTCLSTLQPL
jgi:hypothetical protein